MTEPDDARCPACGHAASSKYCPHCGARTGWAELTPQGAAPVDSAGPADSAGPTDAAGPTVHLEPATVPMPAVARPVPTRAVPEMFSTEFLPVAGPAQAWSQAAEPAAAQPPPAPGLFPGWTGMHPAVPVGGGGGLAPRPERRRRAVYAVLGIAAATAIVLLAALLIAPQWRSTGGTPGTVADKVGPGTAVGSSPVGTSAGTTTATTAPTTGDPAAPSSRAGGPPVRTVTVTTSTGAAPTGAAPTDRPAPTPRSTPTPKSTPRPTPRSTPRPATTPPAPLGVPQRDIPCSSGYVVQLASELDAPRFKARVAALKAAGQVPAGSLAADSARSCKLFTSQVNTLVLYTGPYASKYDGCAARLAGPADAYIKGGNADTAGEYVSCLCPWSAAALPRYGAVGQQGVWVGELQRVLGNRLNIDVTDLTGNWGRFTPGTQAAVRAFQQVAKLPANGVVDARTWSALQSAGC